MKGRLFPVSVGIALTLLVLWLQFTSLPLARQAMQRLDYLAYDLRLEATLGEPRVDPRVVIVDVDEKSLQAEGHWPWPRDRIAELVDRLFAQGAAVVAFDVVFAEAERNSAQAVLTRLHSRGIRDEALARVLGARVSEFDNNARLADKIAGRDVVLGFILHSRDEPPTGVLPQALVFADPEQVAQTSLPRAVGYTGNIEVLQGASPYGGFFSLMPDSDGIYRRAPMLQRVGDQVYPSLALEAVRLYLLAERIDLQTAWLGNEQVVEVIRIGDRRVPTDALARAMIPFHGGRGSFPYVSATDVLHGRVPDATLAGNIVLIGTTAQGLFDLRATPVQSIFPGVEVHANLIAGMLDNRFPVEPSWAAGANFTLTVLLGLLLAFLLPRLSPSAMVLATLSVAAAAMGANVSLWTGSGINLAMAPAVLLVGSIPTFNIAFGFWRESRGRRRLKAMFGQYVPPQLVEEMNRHPDRNYGFTGDSREMSVLFCDIRGFTTLSERLTATQLKELLNQFFTPMTRVVFEHRGTIDKYVGDMIMAFWGAPVDDPEHARHAVSAALAMLREAERLSAAFTAKGLPEVAVGIGINSGVMNVGDMGSEYRRAYTVIGDAVNLASRLEGMTRFYRVGLVIGEGTYQYVREHVVCRELDRVRVKGKTEAVTVYEPLCPRAAGTAELHAELAQLSTALARFRARDWQAADAAFAQLETACPDVYLYALYRQRIAALRVDEPGEDWDGVYERTTK
ncbi:MAG: adenylate/guanylate cyclase domain-containing protein [Gammaproteobacteria bacterium]|nr:adenylate/guanylate cyclase domain-containing protein [Gammaproteobacteria bacterium]